MIQDEAGLRRLLEETRTIAVVGMSARPDRPSNEVAQYLRRAGYTVIPVNPAYPEILGERCYPSLREVPVKIDMVDVFRNPADVMPIVEDAIAVGAKSLWLQLGVIVPEAVARAEAAGMAVVMDHCVKIEHRRLLG
ncbi:CoA-binding protein [Thauera sinica]|uniref:CoA-binding protein n=1 Tax=Thauera sinica TaxID=2665146 RepID=A0ABW1AU32_9RHOO|nr:CoA-binding protein [Thauera sp. K11]ATE58580.1 CoA-binding protein [Thauera sp. K11]